MDDADYKLVQSRLKWGLSLLKTERRFLTARGLMDFNRHLIPIIVLDQDDRVSKVLTIVICSGSFPANDDEPKVWFVRMDNFLTHERIRECLMEVHMTMRYKFRVDEVEVLQT